MLRRGRAPWTLLVVLSPALLAGSLARRALSEVRAMRERGALVAPLVHDLDLPARPGDAGGPEPATTGSGRPRRLVVIGDSAAAGHGLGDPELGLARRLGRALHAADGRATEIRSVAVDGATTADVLAFQVGAVRDAEVVVVGVGVNDAVRARGNRRVRRELAAVLGDVRSLAPEARLTLLSCPDLSVAPGLPGLLRPLLGWRCRIVARTQLALARELEIPAVAIGRERLAPELFGPDGFHPGAEGHAVMAVELAALLGVPAGGSAEHVAERHADAVGGAASGSVEDTSVR